MPTQETINFLVYFHLATLIIGGVVLVCLGAYFHSRANEKERELEAWEARDKFDKDHNVFSTLEDPTLKGYMSQWEKIKKSLIYHKVVCVACFLVGGFFLLLFTAEIWLGLLQVLVNIIRATK